MSETWISSEAVTEMQAVIDFLGRQYHLVWEFGNNDFFDGRVGSRNIVIKNLRRTESHSLETPHRKQFETLYQLRLFTLVAKNICMLHLCRSIYGSSIGLYWQPSGFNGTPTAEQLVELGFTARDIHDAWTGFLQREHGDKNAKAFRLAKGVGAAHQAFPELP